MNLLIFTFNGHHRWKLVAMSVKHYQIVTFDIAGEAGFEPTSTVLETAELPLFYSPPKFSEVPFANSTRVRNDCVFAEKEGCLLYGNTPHFQ